MATDGRASLIDRTTTGRQPKPTSPRERIEAIDVLRGVALFGVFAINIVTEFRVSIFEQFLSHGAAASPIDRAVERFLLLAIDMKAFSLFSLLFGAGLAIQLHSPGAPVSCETPRHIAACCSGSPRVEFAWARCSP